MQSGNEYGIGWEVLASVRFPFFLLHAAWARAASV